MTKSELIALLANKQQHLTETDITTAVNSILGDISKTLIEDERVEIRGFGCFSMRTWGPRHARNPVTGESWLTEPTRAIYFKSGKELRERVNVSLMLESEEA